MPEEDAILSVEGVSHQFGGVAALTECSWALPRGSLSALIGPNGAGKSTLVNIISGALPIQRGRIHFEGADITGWSPHRIAQEGLIRTFQVARDFEKLTVLENMLVAPGKQPGESLWNAILRPKLGRDGDQQLLDRALELLDRFELYPHRNDYAASLSGGQKRLLELARAAMADAKVLLLDEPMAAINPTLIERIAAYLQEMRSWGITFLLVEHNLSFVERYCERVTVMVRGRVLATGSLSELRRNPHVESAYLGRWTPKSVPS